MGQRSGPRRVTEGSLDQARLLQRTGLSFTAYEMFVGVKDHIAGRLLQRTKWSFMAYEKFVRRKRRLVFYEVRDGLLRGREFPCAVKDQPVYHKR